MRQILSIVCLVGLAACGHAEDLDADRPPPSTQVGLPCNNDNDCDHYCADDNRDFPGGFCTIRGCRAKRDCPDGTVCIGIDGGVCLYPCSGPIDCTQPFLGRTGYTCEVRYSYNTADATSIWYKVCIGQ